MTLPPDNPPRLDAKTATLIEDIALLARRGCESWVQRNDLTAYLYALRRRIAEISLTAEEAWELYDLNLPRAIREKLWRISGKRGEEGK